MEECAEGTETAQPAVAGAYRKYNRGLHSDRRKNTYFLYSIASFNADEYNTSKVLTTISSWISSTKSYWIHSSVKLIFCHLSFGISPFQVFSNRVGSTIYLRKAPQRIECVPTYCFLSLIQAVPFLKCWAAPPFGQNQGSKWSISWPFKKEKYSTYRKKLILQQFCINVIAVVVK